MKIETNILEKLTTKYKDKGIIVNFEFTEFGLIIRGFFHSNDIKGLRSFNRCYSYEYLKMTSAEIDSLADEFVQEFESNLCKVALNSLYGDMVYAELSGKEIINVR